MSDPTAIGEQLLRLREESRLTRDGKPRKRLPRLSKLHDLMIESRKGGAEFIRLLDEIQSGA